MGQHERDESKGLPIRVEGWRNGDSIRCADVLGWPDDLPLEVDGQPSGLLQDTIREFLTRCEKAGVTHDPSRPVYAAAALDSEMKQTLTLSAWFRAPAGLIHEAEQSQEAVRQAESN